MSVAAAVRVQRGRRSSRTRSGGSPGDCPVASPLMWSRIRHPPSPQPRLWPQSSHLALLQAGRVEAPLETARGRMSSSRPGRSSSGVRLAGGDPAATRRGSKWSVGILRSSTHFWRVDGVAAAAHIAHRRCSATRRTLRMRHEAPTASRAGASRISGRAADIANICSRRRADGFSAGEPGFEPGLDGAKSLRPAVRPLPREKSRRYHRRSGLAGLSLVRHSARFAALFGGWASGGHDAQDSHCLQAQAQTFAAVG